MATAVILGFIFHLAGDYLLQNDWMAVNKTKNSWACLIHCVLYTLPFSLILLDHPAILIVFLTHFFIDRFRLAVYWIKLVNWNWKSTNYGFSNDKPVWLSTWLMFIVDNIFHILFNTLAIYLAYGYEKV